MFSFLAFVFILQIAHAGATPWSLGAWANTTSYPTNVSSQSCSISDSYIYCVGGFNGTAITRATYFAQITPSGIGNWTQTTPYPIYVADGSCTTYQNHIYCVGGASVDDTVLDASFFAPISASGIGNWTRTSVYPIQVAKQSCIAYGGNIYCIGGSNSYSYSSAVYVAGLNSSGISRWSATVPYPININSESCVVNDTYLYCVGGIGGSDSSFYTASSYYTRLTGFGVSQWFSTTQYPNITSGQSCAASNGNIYCTGGYRANLAANYTATYTPTTYYASLSPSGIGSWMPTTNYPYPFDTASCNSYNDNIYCVGGAYYNIITNISSTAPVMNPNLPTSTTATATTITQVSNGNSTPTTTVAVQQQPTQGNGLAYLIILFLVILILLMVLALLLFNRSRPKNKR